MKKLIILILLAMGFTLVCNDEDTVMIPASSIRMRVIAKSNSKTDQKEKMKVKSILEEKIYDITKGIKDYDEVDETINSNKDIIDEYIKAEMKNNNIDAEFTSNYGYNYFPEKNFKGVTYKSGNYKSYVVTLGNGEGENWWCVLYPPLCLVDESISDYEYHSLIKDIVNKYN